jgi:hypothetical protein
LSVSPYGEELEVETLLCMCAEQSTDLITFGTGVLLNCKNRGKIETKFAYVITKPKPS